jgi:16S rRNA (guanine1207-N2)-methyltransferase
MPMTDVAGAGGRVPGEAMSSAAVARDGATSPFAGLRRWPDLETRELQAWDAADALMLDEAGPRIAGSRVTVVGDAYGALTLGALAAGATEVLVHQDSLIGELAVAANAGAAGSAGPRYRSMALEPQLVAGATLVMLRLPRSLDALEEIAALIAASASPEVVVVAGGRLKHMTVTMNEVLSRHFARLDVSRARQKSRVLTAREPIDAPAPEPRRRWHQDLGLTVVATGEVFAGTSLDIGTRALVEVFAQLPEYRRAIDLGCGTGILAAALAMRNPSARVLATDQSASAVSSAALTMSANGLTVEVARDDALSREPDASADLILLNPPFHTGAAVHSGLAQKLFAESARVLRPGGELWTVWNSHLGYRAQLERMVGQTRQVARGPKFTVTASIRA